MERYGAQLHLKKGGIHAEKRGASEVDEKEVGVKNQIAESLREREGQHKKENPSITDL